MTATLVYPGYKSASPDRATVTVEVRLTRTQIVAGRAIGGVTQLTSSGNISYAAAFGYRFSRKHGRRIPRNFLSNTWKLAPGELERLNAMTTKEGAK